MQYTLALLALVASAVEASPFAMPQGVTQIITPSGVAPAGCEPTFGPSFGIAVHNISAPAPTPAAKRQVNQLSDGQPQAMTMGRVSMITDGQIQAHLHTMIMAPVSQIGDGQVQAPTVTLAPVSVISDGQPQAPTISIVPATTTAAPVSQISDAQPQAPTEPASAPAAPATTPVAAPTSGASPSSVGITMVACDEPGTLALTLADGILKDSHGRTGYIASNFQFQFDDPPQAGSLITAGFSVCGNGSLALGPTNVFWQCLSGNFYNLYDRFWAPQCSPVTINVLELVNCG